jgi:hypothetical protein
MGRPEFDPLVSPDYSGWWSRATTIVRRGWKPLAAIQAVGLVLVLLIQGPVQTWTAVISNRTSQRALSTGTATQADLAPVLQALGLSLAATLVTVIVTAIITLATVHIGVSVAVGAPVRIGDALGLAGRRILPLIGWQLLAVPIYVVGVCLCVVPVFYVAAALLVLPVVVAIERTSPIGRSFGLFHAHLGSSLARTATILGISVGTAVVGGVAGSVIKLAAQGNVTGEGGIVVGSVLTTLVTAVIGGAVGILIAPLTLTAYADMRARREMTHGMTIAQEMGIAPATYPSWPAGYAMPPA